MYDGGRCTAMNDLPLPSNYVQIVVEKPMKIEPPVCPLWDLQSACILVPCTYSALKGFLSLHRDEFKAVYRRQGTGRKVRLLSGEEIRRIRGMMLKGPGLSNVLKPYQPPTV